MFYREVCIQANRSKFHCQSRILYHRQQCLSSRHHRAVFASAGASVILPCRLRDHTGAVVPCVSFSMWLDLKLFWACVNQMGSFCTRLITSFEFTTSSLLSATGSLEGIEIWELDSDYMLYLLKFEGVILLPSTSTWCWLDSILSSSSIIWEGEISLLLWCESEWASDSFSPPSSRD